MRIWGWRPISRSLAMLCCVGFVFNSPAALMYGTRVTCRLITFCVPTSRMNCRMASRNGSPSMSPVVPPISVMTTSALLSTETSRMRVLISSVTCGITCTVLPR